MESEPESPPTQPSEERLVLRPIVKYIAIGLGFVTLLGIEYATYRAGIERGYAEGVASGEVAASVNRQAVDNLRHFMQVPSAADAVLLKAVDTRAESLAWIKDAALRREAEWVLAQALITRGNAVAADAMVRELIGNTQPQTELWVRRALVTARALAAEKQYEPTAFYYDYADAFYAGNQDAAARVALLTERLELLQKVVTEPDVLQKELAAYAEKAAQLGDAGKELLAGIWANKGLIYREQGTVVAMEQANRCFKKALQVVDTQNVPELASAAVCVGSLLLEQGERERAESMLRDGLQRLADSQTDAPYMLLALRDLARMEQENGNTDAALAYLYRAEGVAMTHEPEQSSFWNCLYDQRGWLNFVRESYGAALADFEKALARCGKNTALQAQPLEGAARCCIALGQMDSAERYLLDCIAVRSQHVAADAEALGRVCFYLAGVYDVMGQAESAADYYARAVEQIAAAPNHCEELLTDAMMARAYTLTQLHRWTDAALVWNALSDKVKDNDTLRNQIKVQLDVCVRHGADLSSESEEDEAEE